ncbi:protealysin inhibitor emfourin [Edaphovirga cremea]|jgi:hypothetical protein|uniref:protealysin inhibitor emfourin n=1 Tax=Edaphovirga cremea TaxID=2267246 RepID=UPI003988DA13
MKPISSLDPDAVIELAREGGVAFIPKLAGQRRIEMANLDDHQRKRICTVINETLPYAEVQGQACSVGRGDQRYFRLEIHYASEQSFASEPHYAGIVLLVPESDAPTDLVRLWKRGDLDGDGQPD